MPIFTFYLNKDGEAVPSFEITMFESAEAALAHGRGLLKARPLCRSVEITSDDAEVATLTRDPA